MKIFFYEFTLKIPTKSDILTSYYNKQGEMLLLGKKAAATIDCKPSKDG